MKKRSAKLLFSYRAKLQANVSKEEERRQKGTLPYRAVRPPIFPNYLLN